MQIINPFGVSGWPCLYYYVVFNHSSYSIKSLATLSDFFWFGFENSFNIRRGAARGRVTSPHIHNTSSSDGLSAFVTHWAELFECADVLSDDDVLWMCGDVTRPRDEQTAPLQLSTCWSSSKLYAHCERCPWALDYVWSHLDCDPWLPHFPDTFSPVFFVSRVCSQLVPRARFRRIHEQVALLRIFVHCVHCLSDGALRTESQYMAQPL